MLFEDGSEDYISTGQIFKFETKKDFNICVSRAYQQKLKVELREEAIIQYCAHISVVIVVEFQNEEN